MSAKDTILLFYNATGCIEYVCKALSGSQSYDPVWQIAKFFYDVDDNLIGLQYADGSSNFTMIADDRALYRYTGNLETVIVATENISVFEIFDVTASGVKYTKQGDDGNLGSTSDIFQNSDHIKVIYEAEELDKMSEVTWLSQTTLNIRHPLLKNESLIIHS